LTYLDYVKDGFRRKIHLPLDSREVILAYQDGVDQVVDMEYYQQMARAKLGLGTKIDVQPVTPIDKVTVQSTILERTQNEVLSWITLQLPHLQKEDAVDYCECLIKDGFDSVAFIEEELIADDLDFMKKAHRRVILRNLEKQRELDKNTQP
jgi:hypothetical protein